MLRKSNLMKDNNPVWRDVFGRISCPGDSCRQIKCDDSCPIYLNTQANYLYRTGNRENLVIASELLTEAIGMAPDYKEAMVNLGAIYGTLGKYAEANKAYADAYRIDSKYPNAIYGLIISNQSLKKYEEALRYCDEYAEIGNEFEAIDLRAKIEEEMNGKSDSEDYKSSPMAIAKAIIKYARDYKVMQPNEDFPYIPELVQDSFDICLKILKAMVSLDFEESKDPRNWLKWGFYTGMGAAQLWFVDPENLKKVGVAEALLQPRGVEDLDEYVLDLVGIGYQTPKGDELDGDLFMIMRYVVECFYTEITTNLTYMNVQAMFIFGMAYQLERLGIKKMP